MQQTVLLIQSSLGGASIILFYDDSTINKLSIIFIIQNHIIHAQQSSCIYPYCLLQQYRYIDWRMGNKVCQTCQTIEPAFNYIHTRAFKSIEQMQIKFRKYAQDNLLSLYGRRMQQTIQKLFTFQQFHLCDLLIKLSCQKKIDQVQDLLLDIQDIDLQQLDHLTLIENVPLHVVERIDNVSNIYYNQQREELHGLKTVVAKNIQNKSLVEQTMKDILQTNKFAVLTTVECLGNTGAFQQLKLPTKKTPLQMFVQKVQAINSRYHCAILVVFIVNPRFERQFERQMDKLTKFRDFQSNGETQTTIAEFKYQKIFYKPPYPCVDQQRKIIVQNNKIKFDYQNGDFVGFFMKKPRIQNILHRFEYLQIANVSSLTQKIADTGSLVYLQSHTDTYLVAHAKKENELSGRKESIKVKKNFVQRVKSMSQQQLKKPHYSLMSSYYLKGELYFQKDKHRYYNKLISTRIKSNNFKQLGIVFTRNFDNVLYAPLTLIILDDQQEIFYEKNKQLQYSNFCKKKLGITDTLSEEMVQICPYLLFGAKQQLKKVINKLRAMPQIGFPLVVNKQKIEQMPRRSNQLV